ncbi:hypothetical protein T552_02559 [Pneumocystis carinii B80]|uniref:Uncharacterized protein n=1 Tax=Pneumocystis carinii (strain B80) TaxID=1408658 RepID=A0A0W4ZFC8_PNEC8|nr:hypothetical protein T552_02559 [Pneumocystis carinii B80]KTW27067.1 hypothetical protein T552_02559 [Pneumocystis carinii B80]
MIDKTQKRFFDETDEKKAKRLKSDEDLKPVSNNLTREEIIQKGRASILEKINKMKKAHTEKMNSLDKSTEMKFHTIKSDIQKRIQEHKNLVSKSTIKARMQDNSIDNDEFQGKGGLSVGVHPSLLVDTSKTGNDKRNKIRPKFATTMANLRTVASQPRPKKQMEILRSPTDDFMNTYMNIYYDPRMKTKSNYNLYRSKAQKALIFNEPGKYIEQANALKAQARLEELKKRIADNAKKVGLEEELDVDKALYKEAPPDIEWWDEGLVTNKSYNDLDIGLSKIDTPDSIISLYIQHPIPIPPPFEKNQPPPKALMLTEKERRKSRRQRRAEDLKMKQDKQRLGLEEPEPPKVKLSNLMRVLTSEAIKDPTRVEAMVRRQVAERKEKHEQENNKRKLTPNQKREKLRMKKAENASRGIYCNVFRVEYLSHGQHRFKIDKNAEQHGLTGITILHPKFNLVVVEGGSKGIKRFKDLMLRRINWTDAPISSTIPFDNQLIKQDEHALVDYSKNKCELIWEGELRNRNFRTWKFRSCSDDKTVKDVLEKGKAYQYWNIAKCIKEQNDFLS